jgi:transcriptional antiterminator RfaH
MLLTAAEILRGPSRYWYCVKSQPKRKHIAAAFLRQTPDVEAFCPRVRYRKQTTRGPVWFVEAMFPGYLFARFDYAASHRRVQQGRGISGLVQFGDRFGLLPEDLIAELKARVSESELVEVSQQFVPGQKVEISQGPFQGLEALVTRLVVARDRVEMLIEWMGRSLRAESNAADLLPL